MKYNLVQSGPRQSSLVVRAPGIYLEAAWGPQFKSLSGPFSAIAAGYITRDFSMYGVCRIYPNFFFSKWHMPRFIGHAVSQQPKKHRDACPPEDWLYGPDMPSV